MSSESRGYAFLTIAIIGWGASAPLIEVGLREGIPPLSFLFFRFLTAALLLTPYVVLKRRDILGYFNRPLIWAVGISEALGLISQYLGQKQQVPPGLAALLSLLFLLIVPFIAPVILNERFQPKHFVPVSIALVGVIFISSNGDLIGLLSGSISVLGVFLLILAAIGYAFYIVFTSKLRNTDDSVDTFGIFYCIMVIISIFTAGAVLFTETIQSPPQDVIIPLLLLVLFSTLIAFVAYFEAMRTVSANVASVLLLTQVFVAFILEFLFLSATYGIWVIAGSVLILIAMFIAVTIKPPELADES